MDAKQENTNEQSPKPTRRSWTREIVIALAVVLAVAAAIPPFTRALEERR